MGEPVRFKSVDALIASGLLSEYRGRAHVRDTDATVGSGLQVVRDDNGETIAFAMVTSDKSAEMSQLASYMRGHDEPPSS